MPHRQQHTRKPVVQRSPEPKFMSVSKDLEETPNVKSQVVVVLVVPDHDHRCMLRGAMAAPRRHLYQVLEETDPEKHEGALRMALYLQMAPPEITTVPVTHLARLA